VRSRIVLSTLFESPRASSHMETAALPQTRTRKDLLRQERKTIRTLCRASEAQRVDGQLPAPSKPAAAPKETVVSPPIGPASQQAEGAVRWAYIPADTQSRP
jgi:hypothetical protein